ncbi:hypothetical protein [Microbacterium sp. XT11]|uniref:hypothetical protein n=1 Tax=Microbacterium sp. XT11 TaxID=367477 RepID=UPI000A3DDA12|nr:hypothetical protein [Microbacterium sp. XT11]
MTEPQIWTALGILAAALTGMIAVATQLMMRTIAAQFDGFGGMFAVRVEALRTEMIAGFEKVHLRFEAVDRQFEAVDRRFEHMDERLDGMDKRLDGMEKRLDGMDKRLDGMEKRLDRVELRLDGLDGDVRTLMARTMPLEATRARGADGGPVGPGIGDAT